MHWISQYARCRWVVVVDYLFGNECIIDSACTAMGYAYWYKYIKNETLLAHHTVVALNRHIFIFCRPIGQKVLGKSVLGRGLLPKGTGIYSAPPIPERDAMCTAVQACAAFALRMSDIPCACIKNRNI